MSLIVDGDGLCYYWKEQKIILQIIVALTK